MPTPARSFADDLRARSDAQLTLLLKARPDAARPAPSDFTSLAARLQTRASVQRALENLNARELRLIQALQTVGADDAPHALRTTKKAVAEGITDLWNRGLIWRSKQGWQVVRAVDESLPNPAHLGAPASTLGMRRAPALTPDMTPQDVAARLATLSGPAQSVLNALRWGGPKASFDSPKLESVRTELIDADFLAPLPGAQGVIPREVGLALRDGHLFESTWEPAELDLSSVSVDHANAAAAGDVLELLWRADEVASFLDSDEPRVLRTGGLAVRDHRRIASAIDATSEMAAFVLEVGFAAGWWASDGEIAPVWRPTSRYDESLELSAAERWAHLALAWRDMSRAPSLAGQTIDGTLINVLGRDANWPMLRGRRHDVLAVLDALPRGEAPTTAQVDGLLRWRRPLRLGPDAPTRAETVLREASWLGVVELGTLTDAGRALARIEVVPGQTPDVAPAAQAMDQSMPDYVSQVMLQADLTAIAPGPLTSEAGAFMRTAANIESHGGATVYRFTPESVRRLLDTGLSATDAIERLRAISMTGLPQPLEYLVNDIARRHGQVRVGSVSSYVRSDDEAALDALVADGELGVLHLRRIAPTVLVSSAAVTTVLEVLREHRYAPVAETSDGGVVVAKRQAPRAPTPREHTAPVTVSRLDNAAAANLIKQVRAGDQTAAKAEAPAGPRIPAGDPTVTLRTLQDATADRLPVWIGYTDATGEIQRGLFRPERVDGGRVTGQLGEPPRTQTFSIHRITGVVPA